MPSIAKRLSARYLLGVVESNNLKALNRSFADRILFSKFDDVKSFRIKITLLQKPTQDHQGTLRQQ
jgi:hypothetical protein